MTTTNQEEIYQTKDGRIFDNYSDFVQAKRDLNKQRLQELGLNGPLLGGIPQQQVALPAANSSSADPAASPERS